MSVSSVTGTRPPLRAWKAETCLWILVAAMVISYALWQAPCLSQFPWKFDEGIYAQEAALQMDGHRLYRDIWSERPPLFSWMLAAAFKALGRSLTVGRGLVLATALLAMLSIAILARHLGEDWRGRISALVAPALLMLTPHFFGIANKLLIELPPVSFALAAMASATLFARAATQGWRVLWLVLCALAFATSLLIKPVTAPMLVPLCMLLVEERSQPVGNRRWCRKSILSVLALGAVMVLPALAMMLYYGPSTFVRHIVGTVFAMRGAHELSLAANWAKVCEYFAHDKWGLAYPWLLASAALGLLALWRHGRRWASCALIVWLALALVALMTHTPIRRHHLYLLQPPLIAAASIAAAEALTGLASFRRDGNGDRVLTGLCLAATIWCAVNLPRVTAVTNELRASELAPRQETPIRQDGIAHLQAYTPPGSVILCDDPMLAFKAGRPIPPMLAAPSFKRIESGDMGLEPMLALVRTAKPAAIVCWERRFDRVPGFRDWLDQRYVLAHAPKDDRRIYVPLPGYAQTDAPLVTTSQGIALLGAAVARPRVEPGGTITADIVLRAASEMGDDYALALTMTEPDGRIVWAQADVWPLDNAQKTHRWRPGQMVLQRVSMDVAKGASSGPKALRLALYEKGAARLALCDAEGNALSGDQVALDAQPVVRWTPVLDAPAASFAQHANLGSVARLVGYDLSREARTVTMTLYWQCLSETTVSYQVFCHLIDASGELVTQSDGSPAGGRFPTQGWIAGEYITDQRSLTLPEDVCPGECRLMIGLYDLATGQRLVQPNNQSAIALDQPLVVE